MCGFIPVASGLCPEVWLRIICPRFARIRWWCVCRPPPRKHRGPRPSLSPGSSIQRVVSAPAAARERSRVHWMFIIKTVLSLLIAASSPNKDDE
ncbi:hypothetical protein NQZ68_032451 [Dissostichus eleginoides]|nr:hypothetical protein NQZ68_032451 [Dissostichus eleginoides]